MYPGEYNSGTIVPLWLKVNSVKLPFDCDTFRARTKYRPVSTNILDYIPARGAPNAAGGGSLIILQRELLRDLYTLELVIPFGFHFMHMQRLVLGGTFTRLDYPYS